MIPPGHIPPVLNTEDIPIHRGSVMAMGMSAPADTFKPYVYRGTGEDQIESAAWLRAEAERERAAHWEAERKAAALRAQRRRRQQREQAEEQRQIDSIPRLIADMFAGIEDALARAAEREIAAARARARNRRRGRSAHAVPSPGWRPMTGEDIDALLSELE